MGGGARQPPLRPRRKPCLACKRTLRPGERAPLARGRSRDKKGSRANEQERSRRRRTLDKRPRGPHRAGQDVRRGDGKLSRSRFAQNASLLSCFANAPYPGPEGRATSDAATWPRSPRGSRDTIAALPRAHLFPPRTDPAGDARARAVASRAAPRATNRLPKCSQHPSRCSQARGQPRAAGFRSGGSGAAPILGRVLAGLPPFRSRPLRGRLPGGHNDLDAPLSPCRLAPGPVPGLEIVTHCLFVVGRKTARRS